MGGSVLFSVLLGSAALLGALAATPSLKGWKALLLPLVGSGVILIIWNLASLHFPH